MIDYLGLDDSGKNKAIKEIVKELESARVDKLTKRAEAILSGRVAAAKRAATLADPQTHRRIAESRGLVLLIDVWPGCGAPIGMALPASRVDADGLWVATENGGRQWVCSPIFPSGNWAWSVRKGAKFSVVDCLPKHRVTDRRAERPKVLNALVDGGLRVAATIKDTPKDPGIGDGEAPDHEDIQGAALVLEAIGFVTRDGALAGSGWFTTVVPGDLPAHQLGYGASDEKLAIGEALTGLPYVANTRRLRDR